MTFDPNSDLIWGLSVGQQGKIISGVFADIDKTTGTLCPKSAHTSKKLALKPPVYAISPDLGRRLLAFSLHCRLTGFEVHFTGEIENPLAFFFSGRLFYYLR